MNALAGESDQSNTKDGCEPLRVVSVSLGLSSGLFSGLELSVLLKDVLMRCPGGRNLRVMVSAQDIGSAFQRVMANSPTPLGMAIDLTHARIHPDADCAYEGRLTEVGTKAGPEVVVQVRPSVERAGMQGQPMSYASEERNEKRNSNDQQKEGQTSSQLSRMACSSIRKIRHPTVVGSSLGWRSGG